LYKVAAELGIPLAIPLSVTDQEQEILEAVQALTLEVLALRDENKRLKERVQTLDKIAELIQGDQDDE